MCQVAPAEMQQINQASLLAFCHVGEYLQALHDLELHLSAKVSEALDMAPPAQLCQCLLPSSCPSQRRRERTPPLLCVPQWRPRAPRRQSQKTSPSPCMQLLQTISANIWDILIALQLVQLISLKMQWLKLTTTYQCCAPHQAH